MAKRGRPRKAEKNEYGDSTLTGAQLWLQRITRAKKIKSEWLDRFRVQQGYEYYEGRNRPPHVSSAEWISVNLIYSSIESILPSLYSIDPYYHVRVKTSYSPAPEAIAFMDAKSKVRQAMMNYLKLELGLKAKARMSVKDAMFAFGVAKIHFKADLVPNPLSGSPVVNAETGYPQLDGAGNPIIEPEVLPANEAYVIERVHPYDFLVDADAGPLNDSLRWVAQRIKYPLAELKEDSRLTATVRGTVVATECSDEAERDRDRKKYGGADGERKPDTVVCWEAYDLKNEKWCLMAEGNTEFLIPPSDIPDGIDGHPFVDLRFTLLDDSWYPIPPVSQWQDSQREYCEVRSKILSHRKRFNRKYEVYTPALDDPVGALSKLEAGEDGTCLEKNQPTPVVTPIQDAPLDMQVHTELAYLRNDFNDLAVGSNQRGGAQGVDSATEAGIIERRAMIREGDRVSIVTDFLTDIGRKLDQTVSAHITREQAVRVTGPQGELWEVVRPEDYEDIEGEYEYSIAVGSTQPALPEIERAQLTALLGLLANAPQFLTSKTLLKELARMHRFENEGVVEELFAIGQQMMQQGAMAQGGAVGSMPGSPPSPVSGPLGAAAGVNNIRGGKQ